MVDERTELVHLVKDLLRRQRGWQRKALSLSGALSAILREAPEDRAAMDETRMQQHITNAERAAEQIVAHEYRAVEDALNQGSDVRSALRQYLAQAPKGY